MAASAATVGAVAIAAAASTPRAATGANGGVGTLGGATRAAALVSRPRALLTRLASMSTPSMLFTPNWLAMATVSWPALHPMSRQSLPANHSRSKAAKRGSRAPPPSNELPPAYR